MSEVFLTVLNMSVTAAFVIAALCLARFVLRIIHAPKWISYALWAVAGFNLVSPFKMESAFSLIPFNSTPIPRDIAMRAIPRVDSGISVIDNAVSGSLPAAAPMASVNPLQVWIEVGAYIWLFGVAAMLLYAVISYVRLIRRKDSVTTPFVYGFIKPEAHIPSGLTGEELRCVTLHEQTHIKRRDYLVKMVAFGLLCVHWFNPLVWAAFALLCADMEMSCDERVLRELGMGVKADYSQTLLSLSINRRILGASPLAFGEGGVRERVKNVLNFKKSPRIIIAAAVVFAAVLTAGFAVNGGGRLFPITMDTVAREPHFAGIVTAVYDKAILVSVNEDEEARGSSDLIEVPLDAELGGSMTGFLMGDEITVYYDGVIAESYPARINRVYAIVLTSPDRGLIVDGLRELSLLRTPYVGDNSAVGKIADALPPLDGEWTRRFFSIGDDYGTGHAPYTLTLYYEGDGAERNITANITAAPKNAALLFALIGNLEEVSFAFRNTSSDGKLDQAAYASRITAGKEQIGGFIESAGLTWDDFLNDFETAAGKLFAQPADGAD